MRPCYNAAESYRSLARETWNLSPCHVVFSLLARFGENSALSPHPSRDVFATVSEDSTLVVWSLPAVDAPTAPLFSAAVADNMLCGAAFDADGSLVVSAYDTQDLYLFKAQ